MIDGMFVLDAHNHLNPGIMKVSYGLDIGYFQDSKELIARMDENGVDKAVVFSSGSGLMSPEHFKKANEFIAEEAMKHSDRLIGFCGARSIREATWPQRHKAVASHAWKLSDKQRLSRSDS